MVLVLVPTSVRSHTGRIMSRQREGRSYGVTKEYAIMWGFWGGGLALGAGGRKCEARREGSWGVNEELLKSQKRHDDSSSPFP